MNTPDHVTLVYAAEALERAAQYTDGLLAAVLPGRRDGALLREHQTKLRAVAAWLRELVREQGEQPVTGLAELAALRAGAKLAGVRLVHGGDCSGEVSCTCVACLAGGPRG